MPDITLTTLQSLKQKGEKITMLTCYDATFAQASCEAGVEVLLIGDSLGMVSQGHDSTLPVTVAEVAYHTASVKRGNQGAFIVADLPFMAYATVEQTLHNSAQLMQAGANMVKVEGAAWLAESIRLLAERGVPVCAHMGLTPQSVNLFGGYKVHAIALEQAGAAMILLECVPSDLAAEITQAVKVPVIGIGAGSATDGPGAARHARPVHQRSGAQVREKLHGRPDQYPGRSGRLRQRSQGRHLPRHRTRVFGMNTVKTVRELRAAVGRARSEGKRIGFVPTMGNLHAGHAALVTKAANPLQFGANEDLDKYPRTLAADQEKLLQAGCHLLFAPTVEEMYPDVSVPQLSEGLCGASRPGHFEGVATVVSKLFNMVQPDLAVFGQKDFQQLAVIRALVHDLNMPIQIIGEPTPDRYGHRAGRT